MNRWWCKHLFLVSVGMAVGMAIWGCGPPRTPYPASLNSQRPQERASACKHAAEIGDCDVLAILVDRLEDPDEGVRFFSILALEKLTGTRLGYNYRADESRRWRAVQQWRQHITQQGLIVDQPRGGSAS